MTTPINLVIFASREEKDTLLRTLICGAMAIPDGSRIDILINGNPGLSKKILPIVQKTQAIDNKKFQLWNIPLADKGNAWNQHIHKIHQQSMNCIYIDGYVRINKEMLERMCMTLDSGMHIMGTSGIPSIGLSANRISTNMHKHGGFHGNFCAIKCKAITTIRERRIKIPLGMYRVDSAMGAFLSFGLDNIINDWNPFYFLPVTNNATWEINTKKWYNIMDLISWIKRQNRQAKGDIENAALKFHLTQSRTPLEGLPSNVRSLVEEWATARPIESKKLSRKSLRHKIAMKNINKYTTPQEESCSANLTWHN